MFQFLKKLLNKKKKIEPRTGPLSGSLPIPSPEVSPDPVNIAPKRSEIQWVYPNNWKYVADPDGGKRPLKVPMPVGIVIHHTVTYNLNSTVEYLAKNEVDVHFVIGKEGDVVQMVPCNLDASHAGESEWGKYKFLNGYFIGIEVVNIGPLTKKANKYFDTYGREYKGDVRERKTLGELYWEPFTEKQEESLYFLCKWLIDQYGIPLENVIAHYEASPKRKIDPAGGMKHWPMQKFRDLLR